MEFKDINTFREMKGEPLPIGSWIKVTQNMINAFAEATLDFQWIHVDVEKASKHSPFKAPIAHGFMSVSLLSKMIEDLVKVKSAKMGVNYGLNKVRFPHPVVVNSRLRLHCTVSEIDDYAENGVKITWSCLVEIENIDKPACVGEFITLLFE